MTNTFFRDVAIIGVIGLATAWGLNNRPLIYQTLGFERLNTPVSEQTNLAGDSLKKPSINTHVNHSGSVVAIPKNPQDGQFWTNARVNSGYVKFLVDTGAGAVALTLNDAKKAGIKVRDLKYNVPIHTAGGKNYAASVKIKSLAVGGITLRDIDALIVKDGLHVSLLGMTYLGQLQKVEATPSSLILRL